MNNQQCDAVQSIGMVTHLYAVRAMGLLADFLQWRLAETDFPTCTSNPIGPLPCSESQLLLPTR